MGEDDQSFTFTFIPSKRLQPSLNTIQTVFADRDDVIHKEMSWTKELRGVDLVVLNSGAWWANVTLYEVRSNSLCPQYGSLHVSNVCRTGTKYSLTHLFKSYPTVHCVSSRQQRMKDVFGYLDANYSGRTVFRTSPRGHPSCRDYENNGPTNPTDESYDFEPETAKLERTVDSARVDWW